MTIFKDNQQKAKYVKYCFVILGGTTGLNILVIFLGIFYRFYFRSFQYSFSFLKMTIFLITGIVFLIWYEGINKNYGNFEIRMNKKQSNYSNVVSVIWLIPFLNAFFHYGRLKRIYFDYEADLGNTTRTNFNIFINIWLISFLGWYVIQIIGSLTVPLFPEDIDIYYMMNPIRELIENVSLNLLEIIGLISMFKIIKIINAFEKTLILNSGK